jgi:lysophospholipase L1-like esterase
MERLKIFAIGGSASNNFGNAAETLAWPERLAHNLGDYADVTHLSRSGLTFVRGINKLAKVDSADVLIMHFGTSIGWPISIIKAGTVMGIDFATDHGFNQPTGVSAVKKRRVKNFFKRSFRNTVKYILFFVGLYKPRASKRELNDQIDAVINLALKKSDRLIWIQHRAFMNHRIVLEKWVYDRYYRKIMQILKGMDVMGLTVLEIPDDFVVAENYLFDCIHLSSQGHKRLEQMVREVL